MAPGVVQDVVAQYQQTPTGNAPTAMMIDPSLQFTQAQDSSSQQGNATKVPQAAGQPQQSSSSLTRTLPSWDINQESIDDAYVQFVFYCNPSIPSGTDTTELRKGFRSMPKSDGKSFDTFALFELIKKLEAKEIETWSQLVIDLGVEPPDPAKNQSAQKVQQFAVRMKRWLHAFHIDAFFHYCLGKPTSYSTELPPPGESISDRIRDGVPPEEDLALRALLPEWRPKRGRRKLDGTDGELGTPPKRTHREGSLNAEGAITPQENFSAHPAYSYGEQSIRDNAWAAAHRAIIPRSTPIMTPEMESAFWMDAPGITPSTPYPQSAITPRHSRSTYSNDTPQSAHPLTAAGASHPRKRHGPTVSAAWSSGGSTASGKNPRGRPPNNRSVQDGPFSTFPANPQATAATPRTAGGTMQTPQSARGSPAPTIEYNRANEPATGTPTIEGLGQTPTRKPSKLSLQVPQHAGGPVRLATPPPKVLLNGQDGASAHTNSYTHERRSSADFFTSVEDELSELLEESDDAEDRVDWKRRALLLQRKLQEKEAELKAIRRRVMEAVM